MSKISILINSMKKSGAEKQCAFVSKILNVENIYLLINKNDFKNINHLISPLFQHQPNRTTQFFFGIIKLAKRVEKNELIISFMELSNFINIATKIFFRKHKAVVSVRISPSYYKKIKHGYIVKLLIRLLYPYADLIIANSNDCKNELAYKYGIKKNKIIFIPNAHDILNISRAIPQKNLPEKYIISIGRLEYQKNIHLQIDILRDLLKYDKDYKLIIVGEGSKEDELIKYTKSYNLKIGNSLSDKDCHVYFLGFINDPYKLIKKESIFILSSYYEGMPNVIIEAMARGAIVLSTNCETGPRELIAGNEPFDKNRVFYNYGLLFPISDELRNNSNSWAKEIISLNKNPKKRIMLSNKSQERSHNFSEDKISEIWLNSMVKL